jgi:hypothetical protein
MANDNITTNSRNTNARPDVNARQADDTRDPEFEMPDPEQTDREIEQAERIFGQSERKPAKDKDEQAA